MYVFATLTLAEYTLGADLKIDRMFIHIPLHSTTSYPSGRSAPETAGVFLILSAAVVAIDMRIANRVYVTDALSTLAWLLAVLPLAGYVYGSTALYRGPIPRTGIAPHTIVGIFALSFGLLCLRPDRPMMRLLTSSLAGGFVVRKLLLGALAIPGIGLLVMVGSDASLYEQPFAAALLAVSAMAIALILVFFTGRALDRLDAVRTESERHVAESEERLGT